MGIRRNGSLFFIILCVGLLSWGRGLFASSRGRQSSAYGYYLKARITERFGDIDAALKLYDRAGEADPYSLRIPFKASLAYLRLGKVDAAQARLLKAKQLDPNDLDIRFMLALAYSSSGQEELAGEQYEFILKKQAEANPDNVEIVLSLARLYYQQKKMDEAIAQYRNLLEIVPDKARVYLSLGNLLSDNGDIDAGIANIEKALRLDPNNPDVQNSLGYLYAQKGEKLDYAVSLIKNALEKDGDNAAYIDSLGWVYFKQGRLDEALRQLERAVKILADAVIYDHLGDVYFARGMTDKALSAWRRSLELDPEQKKVREKIDEVSSGKTD